MSLGMGHPSPSASWRWPVGALQGQLAGSRQACLKWHKPHKDLTNNRTSSQTDTGWLFHCSSPPGIIYIPFYLLTCNLKPTQCQQPNLTAGQLAWSSPRLLSAFLFLSLPLLLHTGIRLATVRQSRSWPRQDCVPVQWLNMGPVYFFRVAIFKGLK